MPTYLTVTATATPTPHHGHSQCTHALEAHDRTIALAAQARTCQTVCRLLSLARISSAESGAELVLGKSGPDPRSGIVSVVRLSTQPEGAPQLFQMCGKWKGCSSLARAAEHGVGCDGVVRCGARADYVTDSELGFECLDSAAKARGDRRWMRFHACEAHETSWKASLELTLKGCWSTPETRGLATVVIHCEPQMQLAGSGGDGAGFGPKGKLKSGYLG